MSDLFGESFPPPTVSYEGQKHQASELRFFFLLLLKDPRRDRHPVRNLCGIVALLRWLSASIAHSLRNLSCAAAEDFHSPAQPKYQNMCQNGKCRHTLRKKPLQWRVSCVPVCIHYTNMSIHRIPQEKKVKKVFFTLQNLRFTTDRKERCGNFKVKKVTKLWMANVATVGQYNCPRMLLKKTISQLIDIQKVIWQLVWELIDYFILNQEKMPYLWALDCWSDKIRHLKTKSLWTSKA